MNSNEHVEEFGDLLDHLEALGTPSFTIQGNHEEYSDYGAVEEHIAGLKSAEEISRQATEYNGLTVLGIPYSYTHHLLRRP